MSARGPVGRPRSRAEGYIIAKIREVVRQSGTRGRIGRAALVEFHQSALGFPGVRVEEFREGKVGFPSVRISSEAIIDLMPKMMAPFLNGMPGTQGSAGNKVNHFCLAMGKSEYTELHSRLAARGVVAMTLTNSFGAQGSAPEAFYFTDPDGNVLEARYYD